MTGHCMTASLGHCVTASLGVGLGRLGVAGNEILCFGQNDVLEVLRCGEEDGLSPVEAFV